jgi:hypothetical protein
MNEQNLDMMADFYSRPFNFSYSSLSRLLWSPKSFKDVYIHGQREEIVADHLIKGKLIHNLLLDPKSMEANYIVMPSNIPGSNVKAVIDRVYYHKEQLVDDTREELEDFPGAILDIMRDMNFYQNLKTDDQRIAKIITEESLVYWSFLKQKKGKDLIDQETLTYCTEAVEIIKQNKEVCDVLALYADSMSNIEIMNEQYTDMYPVPNYPFGLKGILDSLVVDHENKQIRINDVKTTSKDLKNFKESVEYYDYWMQAAIYLLMIKTKLKQLLTAGYTVEFNFIVIDKAFNTYVFPVSQQSLTEWSDKLYEALDKAKWHYEERKYDFPYELSKSKVYL